MKKIYQIQRIGSKYITDNKRAIIGDEMSLFKTSQAIFAKSKLEESLGNLKTLVVCPYSVKEHWKDEIYKWYFKGKKSKIVELTTDNYFKKIKEAKNADFVIIHYNILSGRKTSAQKARIRALKNFGFKYVILDEVHNSKNPEAFRSKSVKELTDKAEYLALLSGTPMPNNIIDLYMLMSMLEPKKYKIDFKNPKNNLKNFYRLYQRDPHLVKTLLHQRMLRRETKDYIESKLPKVKYIEEKIRLKGEHARIYDAIFNNEHMKMYQKLNQILKASLDPSLVNPKYIQNKSLRKKLPLLESNKYQKLDKIIDKEIKGGNKVLVFTSHFKNGVVEKLKKRYEKYNAEVIEGDVDDIGRTEIKNRFQTDKSTKLLIATIGTMSEGVDLTAANAIVFLDKKYTPKEFKQGVRRSKRIGEVKKDSLRVYSLITKNDVPTIDDGIEKLLEDKERLMNFMLSDYVLSKSELKELFETKTYKARPIREVLMSPRKIIFQHYIFKRNKGAKSIKKFIEKNRKLSERIPDIYLMDWENSLQGNTAKVYKQIIKGLKQISKIERKIDLGSGPFILSRTLNEPVTNVDIDPYMLKKGLETAVKGNIAIESPLHNLPLENKQFDLAVCSLAYQMLAVERGKNGSKIRERELFLKETNRILKNKGYFILNLPSSMITLKEVRKFYNNLNKVGFKVIKQLSGYIEANKRGGDFKIFNVVAQKKKDINSNYISLPKETFEFEADKPYYHKKKQKGGLFKRAFYGRFMISDGNGKRYPLEERIQKFILK